MIFGQGLLVRLMLKRRTCKAKSYLRFILKNIIGTLEEDIVLVSDPSAPSISCPAKGLGSILDSKHCIVKSSKLRVFFDVATPVPFPIPLPLSHRDQCGSLTSKSTERSSFLVISNVATEPSDESIPSHSPTNLLRFGEAPYVLTDNIVMTVEARTMLLMLMIFTFVLIYVGYYKVSSKLVNRFPVPPTTCSQRTLYS